MTDPAMPYRRLGRSGLQLSLLSLGSWVTYHNQVDVAAAREMLAAAVDAGVNFFDNAEVYANGRSEAIMGQALRALARPRLSYVVSTKFFWGLDRAKAGEPVHVNAQETLNRKEYARLCDEIGLGLTTWSPLASGLLTGKYRQGAPEGSRGAMPSMSFLRDGLLDASKNAAVADLETIAAELGCSVAQMAIAYMSLNPHVSSVILGASKLGQLKENLGALKVLPRLSADVAARIDAITKPLAS